MDELDEKILKFLKEDASMPMTDIAKKLKVPKPTVYVRLNKLKKSGIIKKFTVLLSSPSDKMNTAVIDCKDFLISKMTSRTSGKIVKELKLNTKVEFIVRISDTQLLAGWRGGLELPRLPGVENITGADTLYWKD
ncbi:MAG: winged helix-turn-helix transcriptional regulator [Candidatus Micrarchaeota archaeon]